MTTQPSEALTELRLTDDLKRAINEAYVPHDRPLLMANVDEAGRPNVSFRGSTHVHSDDQLAFWARHADGGVVRSLARNPEVVFVYREPGAEGGRSRAVITLRGRAQVVTDADVRRGIYAAMPQRERDADAEMLGVAVIVDLDRVTGYMPGARLDMSR